MNQLLEVYKDRLSFFFSYAHIRDKRKDLTDIKFEDFNFMETLVHDNYLAYHPLEKYTSFYLATPLMVYDDNPEDDLKYLLHFFELQEEDDDAIRTMKVLIKSLYSAIPLPIHTPDIKSLPQNQQQLMIDLLGEDKPERTFFDLMANMSTFTMRLFKESNLYKELRNMIYEGINKGTMTLNPDLDFNQALKNTQVKKTFLEFVHDNLSRIGKTEVPFYDFYLSAYNMLDVFGINKDKVTNKNTPDNIMTDGIHTYFGQYCDYLVTDDATITIKANAMYKLFDFSTQVLSVDEFIKTLPDMLIDWPEDNDWFIRKLVYDLQNSERLDPIEKDGVTIKRLAKNHLYFDFFDTVLEVNSHNASQIVICKSDSNQLSEPNFFEVSQLIGRALIIFGDDIDRKQSFDHHSHKKGQQHLAERRWQFDNLKIELTQFELINKYALVITLEKTIDDDDKMEL
ncbi:hypothetical protein [Mucilaginibacter gotjawali]|uniref:hypothetical protein n=1 Tax=Mucilaginibacter gotjawali TaxID=1550579 RepID=UPI0012FE6872|nr:hypothetical protein [Mucilaginibacter gotjawali]